LIEREKPDLAVLDIAMPGHSGLELAEEIHRRGLGVKVILLTMYNDTFTAKKAVLSAAWGYLPKDDAFEDLLYAIRTVFNGRKFISPLLSGKILHEDIHKTESKPLSDRECDVLRLIAAGLTNRQIGDKLFISVKTVETHRTKIMQKLNFHTTADLVKYAIKIGLCEL